MEIKRVCKKCGEINEINQLNLKKKNIHDDFGEYYKVMYVRCKRCGEQEIVQIDDKKSIEQYRKLKKLIIKCAKKNLAHETISPKDIKKKDVLMKDIRERREKLKEICSGRKFYDENENIFTECLTIEKVGDIIESNL